MDAKRGALLVLSLLLALFLTLWVLRTPHGPEPLAAPQPESESQRNPTNPVLHGRAVPTARPGAASETTRSEPQLPEGAWRISGSVVNLDGRPLAGVPVVRAPDGVVVATSGEDGGFTWTTTGPGEVVLRLGKGWAGKPRRATADKAGITLLAARLLPLELLVLDTHGDPVRGASVGVRVEHGRTSFDGKDWSLSGPYGMSFGPTDEAGRCTGELSEAAGKLELIAKHGTDSARITVPFPFVRRAVLRLRPRLEIQGVVVDRASRTQPLEGRLVIRPVDRARGNESLEIPLGAGELGDFVETLDENGQTVALPIKPPRFEATVGGPGPFLVHFDPDDRALARSDPVEVRAPASDVRLTCPPRVVIRGRLLEAGPERFRVTWIPEPGPSGHARPSMTVRTDRSGAFELTRLAPGAGRLFARCREHDRYALLDRIEAPLDELTLPLQQGAALSGRVIGDSSAGVSESSIRWKLVRAKGNGLQVTAFVQADGSFCLHGLPPGHYDLSYKWVGRFAQWSPWVPVPNARGIDPGAGDVVLTLPKRAN